MKTRLLAVVLFALAGALFAVDARASGGPVVYASYTGGAEYYYDGTGVVGTEFRATSDLTVSQLGIYDWGWNGLLDSHVVGLWNATSGSLLASVTIPLGTGAAIENGYRWVDVIETVTLTSGSDYVIGAFYPGDSDHFATNATISPLFTLIADLYVDAVSLTMPTTSVPGIQGWYGPNLNAISGGTTGGGPAAVVPEPITMFGAFLGLSSLGMYIRRRTKVKAV